MTPTKFGIATHQLTFIEITQKCDINQRYYQLRNYNNGGVLVFPIGNIGLPAANYKDPEFRCCVH